MKKICLFTKEGLTKNLIRLALGEGDFQVQYFDEENYNQAQIDQKAICIFDDSLFPDLAHLELYISNLCQENRAFFLCKENDENQKESQVTVLLKPFDPNSLRTLL